MKKQFILSDLKQLVVIADQEANKNWNSGNILEQKYWKGKAEAYREIINRIEMKRY